MKKHFISGILVLSMVLALLPANIKPAMAAEDVIVNRINDILAEYPNESFFTCDGHACPHDKSTKYLDSAKTIECSNCRLSKIVANKKISGWKTDTDAWTCLAFMRYAFQRVFGIPTSGLKNLSLVDEGDSKKFSSIFQNALPGDVLYCYSNSDGSNGAGHFAMIVSHDSNGAVIYHGNVGETGKVSYRTISYSSMQSNYGWNYLKIYRSTNYSEVANSCDHDYNSIGVCTKCQESYHLVVTDLNITLNVTAVNSSSKTAPAHTAPYGDATIGPRLQIGNLVKVTGMAVNAFGNTWYKVKIDNEDYWIVNSYLSVPVLVQNVNPSKITNNSAYLKASMTIPSGVRVQSCGIAVDTAPNPVKDSGVFHDTDSKLNYTNSTINMWYTATGLAAGTTYHYRFYIETMDGCISYGPDGCFTTTGSSCTHSYNSAGLCTKCRKVEFPLDITNLDTLMTVSKINKSSLSAPIHTAPYGDAPISARFYLENVVKVTGETKNHYGNPWYRVQVGDNTGWVVASYLTSTTSSKYIALPTATPAPTKTPATTTSSATVTATSASQITTNSVRLDGTCSYSGTRPSSVGVYLGTSSSSMTKWDSDTISHNKNPFNIWYTLSGLSSGTTYYYKFYAIVNGKEYVSSIWSFTTNSLEQPTTAPTPTPAPTLTPTPTPTPAPVASSTGYVVGAGWLAINDKAAASPQYSNEIGSIPDGAAVTVYTDKTSGNWYYVSYNGVTGYAYKSYITFNTRTGTVSGTNSLAINNKAASSPKYSTEIGSIPGGASVRVYPDKTSGNWYYVTYNSVTGYAYKSYITLN